ncbi:flagellar biosynthetic protein FliR [Tabrizicola sp. WMC-M-20]|nr:flagellar biosynthetic protein FliR [Tabrizicola sp. WMC-M-20]
MDLDTFVSGQVFGVLLVFARIGSALLFMPGFGDSAVLPRGRLAFALALCIALAPATPVPPLVPDSPVMMVRLIATETLIGLWIGLTARILLSALHFAGYQAGYAAGLANAFAPSIGSFEGATSVASFLLVSATALIFITDTHHVMLRALLYSYDVFPFGLILIGDLADQMARAVSGSLYIGLGLAAPFFVMGLLLNLGLGLANRMMPTLPVFFVAGSALIAAGILVLAFAAPSMLRAFLSALTDWFSTFTI